QEVIDMCIQASRTSLFTNSLPPVVAAMALKSVQILERDPSIIESLHKKVKYIKQRLHEEGFEPLEGDSAIVPIIVKETSKAIKIAKAMLDKNVYVTGFGFPVVPEGTARIRIQVSDALSYEDIDYAVKAFKEVFDSLD
ncbi:MAG: aminotransferase class I/II-fold pyridoxal phosphate-dependent enzyme, partial [Clostridia bacterium]|nr:aminotransferase class I/II-fold pyridoxal phosphate-dependent enzyme [Clostridia bacterium]